MCIFTADRVAGDGRVGVAVDQYPVGGELGEHRRRLRPASPGLHAVAARADAQVDVGVGDAEIGEEDVRHVDVVVLAGVNDLVVDADRLEGLGHRRELHELRTGPDDADDAHGSSLTGSPPGASERQSSGGTLSGFGQNRRGDDSRPVPDDGSARIRTCDRQELLGWRQRRQMRIGMVSLARIRTLTSARPTARVERSHGHQPTRRPDRRVATALDGVVAAGLIPGWTAAVEQGGHQETASGGWADLESRRPMTVDTVMPIASLSKPVSAVLVLQLSETVNSDWTTRSLAGFRSSLTPGCCALGSPRSRTPSRR